MSNDEQGLNRWRRTEQGAQPPTTAPAWNEPQPQPQPQRPANPPFTQPAQPAAADDEITPPPINRDPQGREYYQAFRPSPRKCERLEIRWKVEVMQAPRYYDLRDISVDVRKWTRIELHYPLYDVLIAGRNLRHMFYCLKQGRCDFIEAYSADLFSPDNPEGEQAAFIQSLNIVLKQPAQQQPAKSSEKGKTIN